MANLVVTDVCNLKCSFCFAGNYLESSNTPARSRFLSLKAFEKRLDFLVRSGIDEIRFIGGEPSLHPRFSTLIERAQQTGKHIVVFSHGFLSRNVVDCLEALPVEQCTVLINMNATRLLGQREKGDQEQRLGVLRRLGLRALAGFTIFEANQQLEFMLPLILESNCRKRIRLGIAHPVLLGQNVYLHPKQYPAVGHKIARFARTAAESGVRLELDCGFVRCMFSDEDLEALRLSQADIGWRCNPILDIGLTGQVFHCFPLSSRVSMPLPQDSVAGELRSAMIEQTRHYRAAGIYKECSTCLFKQRAECTGGCLANTMKRFQPAAFQLRLPERVLS